MLRVFREISQLGKELQQLGDKTLGARSQAKVAVLVDWDNWWALEYSAGPSRDLKDLDEVFLYYRALEEQNYAVDIIGVEDELEQYEVVVAPLLYMTKGTLDERIRQFVKKGGTVITSYFSGIVDEHDLVITGGYPGRLRDILGIWVEESDALPSEKRNHFIYGGITYEASLLCDLMHLEGAKALADYQEDFYADTPVITGNDFGKGKAYYVGTRSSVEFYRTFMRERMMEKGVSPVLEAPEGIEATERFKDGYSVLFVLNHNDETATFTLNKSGKDLLTEKEYAGGDVITLAAKEVLLLERV